MFLNGNRKPQFIVRIFESFIKMKTSMQILYRSFVGGIRKKPQIVIQ